MPVALTTQWGAFGGRLGMNRLGSLGILVWVLFVGGLANGTSIRRDVRLESADILNNGFKRETLTVFANGVVQKRVCTSVRMRGCRSFTVAQLNVPQMSQVDRMIERSRRMERMAKPKKVSACGVAPDAFRQLTADNGTLLLKRGHACNGFYENTSLPARRLVNLLNRLNHSGASVEGHPALELD